MVALLYAAPLFAQFDFPSLGGRGAAMGGVLLTLDDAMSAMSGSATLAYAERSAIAVGARQDYLAEGMGYAMLGGIAKVGFGALTASMVHFGNSDYNEQMLSLAYGIPLGKSVALGVMLHYLHSGTSDPYYDPINAATFSLSVYARPSEDFGLGFKTFNPQSAFFDGNGNPHLPALMSVGVSYFLAEDLLAVAEVEKNMYQKATLRIGLEYSLQNMFLFRLGINTAPVIYSFGFGMRLSSFGFDVAGQIHNVLGFTPQLSMFYCF